MVQAARNAVVYRNNLLTVPKRLRNPCPKCEKPRGHRCVQIRFSGVEKLPVEVPMKEIHKERRQQR